MKTGAVLSMCFVMVVATVQAGTLKMPPAPRVELEEATKLPAKVGLYISQEAAEMIFVVKTSPFDKIKYPVGAYTAELFATNLPSVFEAVAPLDKRQAADGMDFVVEISILDFDAKIPHPAYNPYLASVVYRVDVYDAESEKIFTQTATGSGQTSKGMMSGFKAKAMCAESAKLAMVDAVRQVLEGLMVSEELQEIVPPTS